MKEVEQIKTLKAGDIIKIEVAYNRTAEIKIEKVTKKMVFYRWFWAWKPEGGSDFVMRNTYEYIAEIAV
jgi:hypothetical protein